MHSRALFFTLLIVAGSFAVPHLAHAAIPFFGPIVPSAQSLCPAGWGLIMIVTNNIIEFALTMAIVFIAPLTIAYAGFLYVVNPIDPSGISKAKSILTNTIVGIVIALAAWMIVDAVMAVLYNGKFGTWSSLIAGGGSDLCLPQTAAPTATTPTSSVQTNSTSSGTPASGGSAGQCSSSNTACSPSALQAAGFDATQANVMSCLAMTESSGVPSTPPYNVAHPSSNSTACGTFQITKTTWNGAASGSCSDFSNCQNAACNAQVAQTLVSQSGYSSWTCPKCNSKAAGCVQTYGGS